MLQQWYIKCVLDSTIPGIKCWQLLPSQECLDVGLHGGSLATAPQCRNSPSKPTGPIVVKEPPVTYWPWGVLVASHNPYWAKSGPVEKLQCDSGPLANEDVTWVLETGKMNNLHSVPEQLLRAGSGSTYLFMATSELRWRSVERKNINKFQSENGNQYSGLEGRGHGINKCPNLRLRWAISLMWTIKEKPRGKVSKC